MLAVNGSSNTTNNKALGLSYQFYVLTTTGVGCIWYWGINPLNFKQIGVIPFTFYQSYLWSFLHLTCTGRSVLSTVFCQLSTSTDHSSQNLLSWCPVSPSASSQCRAGPTVSFFATTVPWVSCLGRTSVDILLTCSTIIHIPMILLLLLHRLLILSLEIICLSLRCVAYFWAIGDVIHQVSFWSFL